MSLNHSVLRVEKVINNHLIQLNFIEKKTEAPRKKSNDNARNEKYDTGIKITQISKKTENIRINSQ